MSKPEWEKELHRDYVSQYNNTNEINTVNLPNSFKEALKNSDVSYSLIKRFVRCVQSLIYLYNFPPTDYITTCFGARHKETYAIYAFVYSTWNGKDYTHHYVCACPTYTSQDGEYRHRVIPYDQYLALQEKYVDVYDEAEKHVLRLMDGKKVEFSATIHYPNLFTGNKRVFENEIDGKRFAIMLFANAWLCDFHAIHNKIVENHINAAYQLIIYHVSGVPVYERIKAILEKIGVDFATFVKILSERRSVKAPKVQSIECGQKLFPLSRIEAVGQGDIRHQAWREIYFAKLCTRLTISLAAPSFPVFNKYFFIQQSDETLYDNFSQHEKFEESRKATQIADLLHSADKIGLKPNGEVSKTGKPKYLNSMFFKLSGKITNAIHYAQANIQLVDVSLCLTYEHTGRTLRDIPKLVENGNMVSFRGFYEQREVFRKHFFEYIWGLQCMHERLRLLHGDLHLNNATLYRTKGPEIFEKQSVNSYFILREKVYGFRHNGIYAMIIDMSRGIYADQERLKEEFSERYMEVFLSDQRKRMCKTIQHYFPTIYEKRGELIESLVKDNLEVAFKMACVVDCYAIARNLNTQFTSDLKGHPSIKPDPEITAILSRTVSICEAYFVQCVTEVASGKIKNVQDFEWPCVHVIENLYADHLCEKPMEGLVADVFNLTSDLKYSTDSYDTLPDLLKLDTEIKIFQKHGMDAKDMEGYIEEYRKEHSDLVDMLIAKYKDESLKESEWMVEE